MNNNIEINKSTNKTSTTKLIIFNSVSNISFIALIGFSLLINMYGRMSWIVLLGIIAITIILSCFFKGFSKDFNALKYIKEKSILSISLTIYLIIAISLVSISSALIIKKYFYTNNSVVLIGTVVLIAAIYLSTAKIKNILDISMFCFGIIPIFYILTLLTPEDRTLRYLFPLDFNLQNLNMAIIILIFPLENTLMFIFNNQTQNGIKTKHFLTTNIFTLLYLFYVVIDSLSLLSVNFLADLRYSSFFRWHLFSGNEFIQNYDIFVLFIIFITVTFRLGYYFQILRLTAFLKQKKSVNIFFFAFFITIIYILYLNVNNIFNIINKLLYFMFFIILIIFLYFVMKSMEVKHEN